MNYTNYKIWPKFEKIVRDLNQIEIFPGVYGSVGLLLMDLIDTEPSDIDFIIDDSQSIDEWDKVIDAMKKNGYNIDPDHEREFIGNSPYISFEDVKNVSGLCGDDVRKNDLQNIDGLKFYLLTRKQLLKIYKAGLNNKYRKQRKGDWDKKVIALLEQSS